MSEGTLEAVPAKTLTFLRAIATNSGIREQLAMRGYSTKEHDLGWELLHKVSGYVPATHAADPSDRRAQGALAELDAWDEPHFRAAKAALARRFPSQCDYVFANLEPASGAGSILSVGTFLDRLDGLEHGADRKHTRKEDHAAIELLSDRGITREERHRLRGLVDAVKNASIVPGVADVTAAPSAEAERHHADMLALHAWYSDWSTTARSFIKRRDHQIRLGLARLKTHDAKTPATPPNAPKTAPSTG